MSLLGSFQRSLDRDRSVALDLALLLDLDVGTSSGPDRIDVASSSANYSRDSVHRNLNLLALHRCGLALLNGALSNDFLPSFLTLYGSSYAAVLQHYACKTTLHAASTSLLHRAGGFLLLLILAVIIGSFAVGVTLLQTAVCIAVAAVEGGRFTRVVFVLLSWVSVRPENNYGLTISLLLLLLLLTTSVVRLLLVLMLLLLLLLRRWLLLLMLLLLLMMMIFLSLDFVRLLWSYIFLFNGFLPLVFVMISF